MGLVALAVGLYLVVSAIAIYLMVASDWRYDPLKLMRASGDWAIGFGLVALAVGIYLGSRELAHGIALARYWQRPEGALALPPYVAFPKRYEENP